MLIHTSHESNNTNISHLPPSRPIPRSLLIFFRKLNDLNTPSITRHSVVAEHSSTSTESSCRPLASPFWSSGDRSFDFCAIQGDDVDDCMDGFAEDRGGQLGEISFFVG